MKNRHMWPIEDFGAYDLFLDSCEALCDYCVMKEREEDTGAFTCPCDYDCGGKDCYRAADVSLLEDFIVSNVLPFIKEVVYVE